MKGVPASMRVKWLSNCLISSILLTFSLLCCSTSIPISQYLYKCLSPVCLLTKLPVCLEAIKHNLSEYKNGLGIWASHNGHLSITTCDVWPALHLSRYCPSSSLHLLCLFLPQFLLFSHFVQLLLSSPFLTLLSLSFPLNLSVCPSFYPLLPSYLHQSPSGGT